MHASVCLKWRSLRQKLKNVTCMYLYVTVCYSYALLCHWFVLLCHLLSLVCAHMSSVCHSYLIACHPYFSRVYFYVIVCYSSMVLLWTPIKTCSGKVLKILLIIVVCRLHKKCGRSCYKEFPITQFPKARQEEFFLK